MPAKSKDQQRAAAIALKAKRDGKVDDLPAGAAKNMAKSMSEKELDKFASTKHEGLPENKPNENKNWAGTSLLETFFAEEMLDTDEEGEAITSDKSTRDQIEDAERDHEDDTGWDAYDDSWDSKVHSDAPMAQVGRPMGSNVTGAARVSYESKDLNSLDILFEQSDPSLDEMYEEVEGLDEWMESNRDIDEQSLGGLDSGWADDWGPGIDPNYSDGNVDPLGSDIDSKLHSSLIDDMVDHIVTHNDLHGKMPDEWLPEELLADFEYDYSVSPNNQQDIEAAEAAIEQAKEEINAPEEVRFESKRWQKLAGMKLLKEDTTKKVGKAAETQQPLKEMSDAQLHRYVKRMAQHKWEWLDVANKLTDQHGVSLFDVEKLKPVYDAETSKHQQEAMLGGVSNGGPAPGHRAKMNEDSDLDFLAQGKAHRVDIFNVRDELAGLAYEIAGEIQGMHLDTSDRKTEKMIQNKLENMYRHLLKLKNLTN